MTIVDRDEFKELLRYPLIQALAHRRARRFPLGCHLPGKSELNYASQKAPLALSELETALLCWAGNGVSGCRFDVCLIPHTMEITTLGRLQPGDRVNLEVDLIARYLERLMTPEFADDDTAVC